jgi:TRAP-type transport system periplasmic protein
MRARRKSEKTWCSRSGRDVAPTHPDRGLGQFTLVNGRVWKSLPVGLQEVVARNFDVAAVKEREDLVKLNQSVQGELEKLGLTFNRADPVAFRAAVSRAGYYRQWKETFGKEAWALLEKYSGPLA